MKPSRRSRKSAIALAALFVLLPILSLPASLSASSHREAPLITEDPVADNTDVYFFRDPVDPTRVVLIGNWIPFEEPAGGPNYFHFAEDVAHDNAPAYTRFSFDVPN